MACGLNAPIPVPESYTPDASALHYLDYTQSKYDAEHRRRTELPRLPLIIVRPTIVVGHTTMGCEASGSIYWVFRLARALRAFPCRLDQKIDVIPVDYCAQAIHHLWSKPTLKHSTYQIASATDRSCTFAEIDKAIALGIGELPMQDYQQAEFEVFVAMQLAFNTLLGPCNKRIVLKAIRSYGYFAAQEVLFSDQMKCDYK